MPATDCENALLELLDSLVDNGATLSGDVVLSLADVNLVRVHLQVLLSSVPSEDPTRDSNSPYKSPNPTFVGGPPGASVQTERAPQPSPLRPSPSAAPVSPPQVIHRSACRHPHETERPMADGLVQLVVALADLLRQLLERESVRRMRRGSLSNEEVERLGNGLRDLQEQVQQLKNTLRPGPQPRAAATEVETLRRAV